MRLCCRPDHLGRAADLHDGHRIGVAPDALLADCTVDRDRDLATRQIQPVQPLHDR
jgi:hypothetical protein